MVKARVNGFRLRICKVTDRVRHKVYNNKNQLPLCCLYTFGCKKGRTNWTSGGVIRRNTAVKPPTSEINLIKISMKLFPCNVIE